MFKVAILLTCYNRKSKTIACLKSVADTYTKAKANLELSVYLTDDGSTDGTKQAVQSTEYPFHVVVLEGTGNLFWNGGMINSWQYALKQDKYDGFLLLNDDTIVLDSFWDELISADNICVKRYGSRGIYVGSTRDAKTNTFTYGGFNFVNKITLKDEYVIPDGENYQSCQCAHGNITYISQDVVNKMGIFCQEYIHGGTDHDYSYLAYKAGFPILVLPNYAGICENDHEEDGYADFMKMSLKERISYLQSPFGFNLHNTLLFQKRCFPYRYPFVWVMGYMKAFFPKMYFAIYRKLRK